MYIPGSGKPYSREDDLIQSLETHQDDQRKQLNLITEQLEHCLKNRCGEWATIVSEKIMEDIKENDHGEFFDSKWLLDISSIIEDLKAIDKKKNNKN